MTLNVLVIDDNEECRNLAKAVISDISNQISVTQRNNGKEGLAEALAGKYALVISDQHMPGMCGTELLKEVRERLPGTKTILAYAQELKSVLCPEADEIFFKPYDVNQLQITVRRLLNIPEQIVIQ